MSTKDEERILTLHPQGKKGVNILRNKYDFIAKFILDTIEAETQISFQDLWDKAEKELAPTFDGKVGWYLVSVKLDLEARKVIERVPKKSPHELRMC